jgi:hypothetical protein
MPEFRFSPHSKRDNPSMSQNQHRRGLLPTLLPAALITLGIVAFATPAIAQNRELVPPSDSRFSITPMEDGYLKLDGRTGVVSECRRENGEFACTLVPDERQALQEEIDRLALEVADLRGQLAARGMMEPGPGITDLPADEPPVAVTPPTPGPRAELPDDREIDRALDLMERFMRRFMNIIREEETQRPI